MSTKRILLGASILSFLALVVVALAVAPAAEGFAAPRTQRIFYFHVPAAWVGYLAFAVTAAASALYLRSPEPRWDRLAAASAEVGTLFSVIALVTGLVWARVEFIGYSPFTDAKVITLVALILAYLAYLALRSGIEEPERRGRVAATFGIAALVGVPLSYVASRISIHPDFTRPESSLGAELATVLVFGVLAFTLLYASLTWLRYDLAAVEARLEALPAPREGAA
jgi:heme exporter protein C